LAKQLNGRFAIGSIDKAIKWAICHWRQSAASGANRKTLFARQELFFLMTLKQKNINLKNFLNEIILHL